MTSENPTLPEAMQRLDQVLEQASNGLNVHASLVDAAEDVVAAYRAYFDKIRCSMCDEQFDDEQQAADHMRKEHGVRHPMAVRFH